MLSLSTGEFGILLVPVSGTRGSGQTRQEPESLGPPVGCGHGDGPAMERNCGIRFASANPECRVEESHVLPGKEFPVRG